jgi:hypothetical protein
MFPAKAQQALLKLIEGTVAAVPPQGGRKHPQQEFLQVDTSRSCLSAAARLPVWIRSFPTVLKPAPALVWRDGESEVRQSQRRRAAVSG